MSARIVGGTVRLTGMADGRRVDRFVARCEACRVQHNADAPNPAAARTLAVGAGWFVRTIKEYLTRRVEVRCPTCGPPRTA